MSGVSTENTGHIAFDSENQTLTSLETKTSSIILPRLDNAVPTSSMIANDLSRTQHEVSMIRIKKEKNDDEIDPTGSQMRLEDDDMFYENRTRQCKVEVATADVKYSCLVKEETLVEDTERQSEAQEPELETKLFSFVEESFQPISVSEGLIDQKNDIQTEKKLSCSFCCKEYVVPGFLETHLLLIHKRHLYQCPFCCRSFATPNKLKQHYVRHSGKKSLVCRKCNRLFDNSNILKLHTFIHNGCHECIVCHQKFSILSQLEEHYSLHTERNFTCDVCNKKFQSRISLQHHTLIHTGERPYVCKICNKNYNQSTHLSTHMRTHTGIRPYECKECGKKFNQSSHLKMHLHIHSGKKPHACKLCSKKFIYRHHLRDHVNAHKDIRPYECDVCSRTFVQRTAIRSHMANHMGELRFVCKECGQKFKYREKLIKHLCTHSV